MYKKIYNFSNSKWNFIFSFVWGFAEATVFFIIPDVYATLIILFNVRAGLYAVVWSIIGSIAGAVCIYVLHTFSIDFASILIQIPGISLAMIDHILPLFKNNVLPGFTTVPFSGIPFKIYVYAAAFHSFPLLYFIFWSIFARILRMAVPILIVLVIQRIFKKYIKKYTSLWLALFVVVWVVFYVWYFSVITSKY